MAVAAQAPRAGGRRARARDSRHGPASGRPGPLEAGTGVRRGGRGPLGPPRGAALPLPGARATGLRVPSIKEGISINPGSRIVTCTYEGGGSIEIAVMPLDVRELLEAVPQAESST